MTIVDSFIEWAHCGLEQSEEAKNYLLSRGVSSEQQKRHRLGYVIGDFHPNPFTDPNHSNICLDRSSVQKWCDSCRFARWSSLWEDQEDGPKAQRIGKRISGCVVLPLTSYSGAAVGFQVRSIVGKQFDSFSLSRRPEGYFFGVGPNMDAIWSRKKVFVVEGPFDHLVFERLVSSNVVGLTTNTSNTHQTRFFRRFVDEVVTLLDMDKAGRDGVESMRAKLSGGPVLTNIKYAVRSNDGCWCKDTNEAWKALGDKRFAQHFTDLIGRTR